MQPYDNAFDCNEGSRQNTKAPRRTKVNGRVQEFSDLVPEFVNSMTSQVREGHPSALEGWPRALALGNTHPSRDEKSRFLKNPFLLTLGVLVPSWPTTIFRGRPPRRLMGSVATVLLTIALVGCAPATVNLIVNPLPSGEAPVVFDDRDWAAVLRENVKDGLVDYAHLSEHREPLTHYLQLIARVGPKSTPELFKDANSGFAYYINAYNAGVLQAVLREKVPETMYQAGRPSLDYRYRLRVDGRLVTLADLRTAVREASGGDVRVEFALCGAALGCPPLSDKPFRSATFTQQLEQLAREAMSQPRIVQINHQERRLLIGLPIAERREAFLAYYSKATGATSPTLLSALLHLADGVRREWLNTAVGYKNGVIPFDRSLNRWTPK